MSENNTQNENKNKKKSKRNPLADIKPKEIPTIRHTYEYHGDQKKEQK